MKDVKLFINSTFARRHLNEFDFVRIDLITWQVFYYIHNNNIIARTQFINIYFHRRPFRTQLTPSVVKGVETRLLQDIVLVMFPGLRT